jgi:penicillin-insensitive murein DD-endopeptidase
MVTGEGENVDSTNWTLWQAALLEKAALDPRVDRIFVNHAIKRALCQSVTGDHGWLGKIRPWWATITTSMSVSHAPRAKMRVFPPS